MGPILFSGFFFQRSLNKSYPSPSIQVSAAYVTRGLIVDIYIFLFFPIKL